MINYNQKEQKRTRNACTFYTVLWIFQLRYGLTVRLPFILRVLVMLESAGIWKESYGAVFADLFNWCVEQINKKLGINVKVKTIPIANIKEDDKETYGIGTPYLTTDWLSLIKDGELSLQDGINLKKSTKKKFGHAMAWDEGYILDNFGNKVECKLATLKELVKVGFLYSNARTIDTNDSKTAILLLYTRRMAESEILGTLDTYFETNKNERWFSKAKELFLYGR